MTEILPTSIADPVNARILALGEDRLQGFQSDPLGALSQGSAVPLGTVVARLEAMLRAGTIRRIRQTLLATNLAHGALVAWRLAPERLNAAFDFMYKDDPFSGHVVIRSTDARTVGSAYRLWTTVKVPQGYALEKHCRVLQEAVGADEFLAMPARRLFVLGVGHVRRRGLEPGARTPEPAEVITPEIVTLDELDWRVLVALKREFTPEEIAAALTRPLWLARADEAGVDLATFERVAQSLNARGVIGRFSTFLEHVKPLKTGERVTQYNALFHWAVPAGRELEAGREVGRHIIMTHAYWREGGRQFGGVNIMGVAHGTDQDVLLAHKAAIDEHLSEMGMPVGYTNVFWGGRSEIKPSEISPFAYAEWCRSRGIDPATMRG
jgi:DNA-binding Lrp family transcriptional regulator